MMILKLNPVVKNEFILALLLFVISTMALLVLLATLRLTGEINQATFDKISFGFGLPWLVIWFLSIIVTWWDNRYEDGGRSDPVDSETGMTDNEYEEWRNMYRNS